MVKYADDTSLTGFITHEDETGYRDENTKFVNWCRDDHLVLNAQKTKEIVFDFRKNRKEVEPVNGVDIEIVTEYKYLGTYIDSHLNWNVNTQKLCSKANQRIYFLRKLKLFNIDRDITMMFYQSAIQSVITFSCIAWVNGLSVGNLNKINRITKSASKIIGTTVKNLCSIYEAALMTKLKTMQLDNTHPLHTLMVFNKSGRLRQLKSNTNRHRLSFVPSAISCFNNSFIR